MFFTYRRRKLALKRFSNTWLSTRLTLKTLSKKQSQPSKKKYGIKVDLVQASTGELFKKAESEKEAPVADVIFGGSYALFSSNENLFEPYISQENDQDNP